MIDCIVVGAGPGGIVTTKELLEKGFENTICLEQSDQLGGVFSRSYQNLVLTSSVTFSMFSDYWVGEGMNHHFWTKEEAVDYWTSYAQHFGVTDKIRFNSKVEKVSELDDGSWELRLSDGEKLQCKRLVMAIGNNNIPRYPEWSNQLTEISYSHSKDYLNSDSFEGKNVLIVGGGESGVDHRPPREPLHGDGHQPEDRLRHRASPLLRHRGREGESGHGSFCVTRSLLAFRLCRDG